MLLRLCSVLCLLQAGGLGLANDSRSERFQQDFKQTIEPLLQSHCMNCHDAESNEAGLDLTLFRDVRDVIREHGVWANVLDRVQSGEMPPADANSVLLSEDRARIVSWITELRKFEADRNAGDPGVVLARRLSNAEFDHSIRDLTGFDLRPTKTFPIDPANEAGFDNSGESLAMSPALINKYLQAVRSVVEHLVLTPTGIRFAPFPVATDVDRDKYCVKRIVAFYERQPTDMARYFYAACDYRRRRGSGSGVLDLKTIAGEHSVSGKYLQMIWDVLNESTETVGPLATLREMWNDLPDSLDDAQTHQRCDEMRDYVIHARRQFSPEIENLRIDGVHKGTQAFVLWKNRQYADHRRRASLDKINVPDNVDAEVYIEACQRFCSVFPDAFYISERGRDYLGKPREEQEKGRLLSAGFHSMMGYFRDDQPLMDLVLDESGRAQLDALWRELDFVTSAPMRQYQGFLWFDRTDSRFMREAQFDFARPEDPIALTQPFIERLGSVYLAKAALNGGDEIALQAIEDYFRDINRQIRWVENARIAAEPLHLAAVLELAERAFRRPLSSAEQDELREFYQTVRSRDELTHEEAIADLVASILISPRFCYRLDLVSDSESTRPLDDLELASRLSFFLWASIPDAELMDVAREGRLREKGLLLKQVRRMLSDRRVRGLATEFAGNWLDIRQFRQHNSVDRTRFPSFDDRLRDAMFEEPIRFFTDMVQHNRSVKDLLYADRIIVNGVLARHYEIAGAEAWEADQWREVDRAGAFGRGALLPMAVFLTKNSPGLRTSPVKRGYWVVRRLLGEHIPPPPPDVPELPSDESKLGEQTLRDALAIHRAHDSCAGCHDRFDTIGLAFERYGPVGELREIDLGGRAVDTEAVFPDGSRRDGIDDLRDYLRESREQEFIDNLCRKLLSYALGRSLILSDESLIQEMRNQLDSHDDRFGVMIESIVLSPQFLNKRGRQFTD